MGKYLGNVITDEQLKAIHNFDLDMISKGDYWIIDGIKYTVLDYLPSECEKPGRLKVTCNLEKHTSVVNGYYNDSCWRRDLATHLYDGQPCYLMHQRSTPQM